MLRVGVAGAGAAAFLLVVSAVNPAPTEAASQPGAAAQKTAPGDERDDSPQKQQRPGTVEPAGLSLGELTGRGLTLRFTTSISGPRCTVIDADGGLLISEATFEEVGRLFPELDLKTIQTMASGRPGVVMLADIDQE